VIFPGYFGDVVDWRGHADHRNKGFFWGSELTTEMLRCGTCGIQAQFIQKTGMRFLVFFFIIPTIPLSGKMHLLECPQCKTRYAQK
jgi:hypothetical protein